MEYFIAILVVAVVGYFVYDRYTTTSSSSTIVDTASEITMPPASHQLPMQTTMA